MLTLFVIARVGRSPGFGCYCCTTGVSGGPRNADRERKSVQDNDWQTTRVAHCPNCGAPNPASTDYCSACGSRIPEIDPADDGTVIDVSGGQPRVLEEEQPAGPFGNRFPGGFTTVRVEQGRVFVTQGSRRNCLIVAAAGLLLVCCMCWVLWSIPARLF